MAADSRGMKGGKGRLSESQLQSPDTLTPEELASRRAEVEAELAQEAQRRGRQLLADGARLLSLRRPGEAAEKLEVAAALLPDDVDIAINLGGAYVMRGQFRKAIPILERAGEMEPDNTMIWINLAAAYLGRLELSGPQQQRQAIAAYERALAINPTAPNVHYNLGLIHKDRGDFQQAQDCFERALAVHPGDDDARYWLGQLDAMQASAASDDPPPMSGDHPQADG